MSPWGVVRCDGTSWLLSGALLHRSSARGEATDGAVAVFSAVGARVVFTMHDKPWKSSRILRLKQNFIIFIFFIFYHFYMFLHFSSFMFIFFMFSMFFFFFFCLNCFAISDNKTFLSRHNECISFGASFPLFLLFSCFSFFHFPIFFASVISEFNKRCGLRCSVEMWCPDDIALGGWDWVGPPAQGHDSTPQSGVEAPRL